MEGCVSYNKHPIFNLRCSPSLRTSSFALRPSPRVTRLDLTALRAVKGSGEPLQKK